MARSVRSYLSLSDFAQQREREQQKKESQKREKEENKIRQKQ